MLLNAFESGIFPISDRNIDDDDYNYANDVKLDPERILMPMSSTTPPIILDTPPTGSTKERGIKILHPKQILQRLPILLSQVKPGNTSENLQKETRKIVCSLYQAKQISIKYTII